MSPEPPRARLLALDSLRGACILSMTGYHLCYDLRHFIGLPLPWLYELPGRLWQQSIAVGFLLLAGISSSLTKSAPKRALKVLCAAAPVTAVSLWLLPDEPIFFGMLHFMGCAMLLAGALRPLWERLPLPALFSAGAALFFLSYPAPSLPGFRGSWALLPLGFPPPGFASADYYPLLPWFGVFMLGLALGRPLTDGRPLPEWLKTLHVPLLCPLGQHSLAAYLLHQPLLLALLLLAERLFFTA